MIIKSIDSQQIKAGDHTQLKEVLHPKNNNLNLPFSLAYAFLEKGENSLLHTLSESEIYYIIAGEGIFVFDKQEHEIARGDCVFVPANTPQAIRNTGSEKLEFICIVTPPWTQAGENILANKGALPE